MLTHWLLHTSKIKEISSAFVVAAAAITNAQASVVAAITTAQASCGALKDKHERLTQTRSFACFISLRVA
jgi:hypothetical protein